MICPFLTLVPILLCILGDVRVLIMAEWVTNKTVLSFSTSFFSLSFIHLILSLICSWLSWKIHSPSKKSDLILLNSLASVKICISVYLILDNSNVLLALLMGEHKTKSNCPVIVVACASPALLKSASTSFTLPCVALYVLWACLSK